MDLIFGVRIAAETAKKKTQPDNTFNLNVFMFIYINKYLRSISSLTMRSTGGANFVFDAWHLNVLL